MCDKKSSDKVAGKCIIGCNEIAYVIGGKDGWLVTSITATAPDLSKDEKRALPKHLKVRITGRKNKRIQFEILEGRYKGKKGSVTNVGTPNLSNVNPHEGAAILVLNLTTSKLTYNGKTIDAFTQKFEEKYSGAPLDPLPVGKWKIEIADVPHNKGRGYEIFSSYAMTWFPIEKSGGTSDRYVHVGSLSHGCATIGLNRVPAIMNNITFDYNSNKAFFEAWTDLYEYLSKSRLDDKYVGSIEVLR